MKRLPIVAAAVIAATGTTAALADGGHPITEKVLGAASTAHPYTIRVARPADVLVAKATVPAGASFGWHSHRSAVVAVVRSGALTLYDPTVDACAPKRYSAGQAFVEEADHLHLARNEGRKPAEVLVTYLGLKHGVAPDVPAAAPEHCPA